MHARSPLPEVRVDLDELLSGYTNYGFAIARIFSLWKNHGFIRALQRPEAPSFRAKKTGMRAMRTPRNEANLQR
jgi:hypothetical protein